MPGSTFDNYMGFFNNLLLYILLCSVTLKQKRKASKIYYRGINFMKINAEEVASIRYYAFQATPILQMQVLYLDK